MIYHQPQSNHRHGRTKPRNYRKAKRAARKASEKSRRYNRQRGK